MPVYKKNGFALIEVVLAAAIISVSFLSLMTLANTSFYLVEQGTRYVQASFLLEEGLEELRILRDSGWTENIAPLNGESDIIYIDNVFERSFTVSDVYRDSLTDDIITTGGILDPNTKKFTVTVSWLSRKGTTTKSIPTYLTNLFND